MPTSSITRIFAVSGIGNAGKTHTVNFVAQELERAGAHRVSGDDPLTAPPNVDRSYIYNWKGHLVGIGTEGDFDESIIYYFAMFDAANCDTVVLACRSRVGTESVDALEREASNRAIIVDYTTLMWEGALPQRILKEQTIAQRIFTRI